MKLIKYFPALLVLFIFMSSCSHKINRIGYSEQPFNPSGICDVVIQKDEGVEIKQNKILGTIKLMDSGFSTACNELDAIEILKKEACSIGGNLVNITKESRPNFRSSCYQCTADIYKIGKDSLNTKIQTISNYDSHKTMERVEEDKKRNRTVFWTSFAVGFVIGFILVL